MPSPLRGHSRTATVLTVYGAALLSGLSVVSFPASANVLKAMHGFSDAEYGAIFLPQVVLALVGSSVGGALAARLGLARLLRAALLAFVAAEASLLGTAYAGGAAYPLLLAGTAFVGLGFGLSAAPLNSWPAALFPAYKEAALVALHTLIGAGFALGPVLVGALAERDLWRFASLGSCAVLALLLLLSCTIDPPAQTTPVERRARSAQPSGLGSFVAIALLYACAEGTFSNWGSVFLHEERGISQGASALALSVFWGALVVGRLVVSALLLYVPAQRVWLALPALMAAAFLSLPSAHDAATGVALFAFAGLACGAFFPLTVSQALARAPQAGAAVSSSMTAALMLGAGLGSFSIGALRAVLTIERIYVLSAVYPVAAGLLALRAAAVQRGERRGTAELA